MKLPGGPLVGFGVLRERCIDGEKGKSPHLKDQAVRTLDHGAPNPLTALSPEGGFLELT